MSLPVQLKALGLRATSAQFDDLCARATKSRWSATQLLEHLCTLEAEDRKRRSLEHRLKQSKVGRFKPIVDFDWSFPTKINRAAVESALHLDFLDGAKNVILLSPHGLGKTMLAKNILYQALLAGHGALFVTAAQLLLDLAAQESPRALENRLRSYAKVPLLCIDEIGYLSFDTRNADLLYEVVGRRYEQKSLILTTNLAFSDWPSIFPSATSATALIDRLVHHSVILPIEGSSYRRRDAETAARSRPVPHKP